MTLTLQGKDRTYEDSGFIPDALAVSHRMGATVALHVAIRHPNNVRKVIGGSGLDSKTVRRNIPMRPYRPATVASIAASTSRVRSTVGSRG
jgi:pimeloyl-ACP methyl ester carboxylesterase